MATIISHNIISPLGFTSEENFHAMKRGESSLRHYEKVFGTPVSITASLFAPHERERIQMDGFTFFESLAIRSAKRAIEGAGIDVSGGRVLFILSTTKANVESVGILSDNDVLPGTAAGKIALCLGFTTKPLVVCNACISGLAAIITASRLIDAGKYEKAVVCGCDILGRFIVSGFDSLKALSQQECRPFDEERIGLNLGEAAATLILSAGDGRWHTGEGYISNDAYHITTPSPKGTGLSRALDKVLESMPQKPSFVNLHGTATLYNDQMEWKALESSSIADIPANAMKGYIGHTMGAAGIIESIISMLSSDYGILLGTRGFQASGVSGNINISSENGKIEKAPFIKVISGFGGCNAALCFYPFAVECEKSEEVKYTVAGKVKISCNSAVLNGEELNTSATGKELLVELYKGMMDEYPRFYKMDGLSRLGLAAVELLVKSRPDLHIENGGAERTAVILFNHSSSLCTDKKYLKSVEGESYFPSPGIFVYTLPNIVNGEIALRYKFMEETSFYIMPEWDEKIMSQIMEEVLKRRNILHCIFGRIDYADDTDFSTEMELIDSETYL